MCASLVGHGYDVTLIVADGMGDEVKNGTRILDAGASKGRFDRIRNAPIRVFNKAITLKSDLYHLHDPELIPIGLKLKRLGHRVIFDSHEDVPKQILGKPYLNKPSLWLISIIFRVYEAWACSRLNGVIAATPAIRDKFLAINANTIDINNFPLTQELEVQTLWSGKHREVCYIGGISRERGIQELCRALGLLKVAARLNIAGQFSDLEVEKAVRALSGWEYVNELGFLDRAGVREILRRSMAGVVTFHPLPNHVDAQPNKMFEYMSAGIPVIASDFPLWRKIISGNDCGLLVDPLDPESIAKAINFLLENPKEAQRMGENGRRAVEQKYNWTTEKKKQFKFYENVLKF
jgi:glycosyltransferase involved in cell wall biosynthesis